MKLLGQRQRTLLLTAQQATDLVSVPKSPSPKSHGTTQRIPDGSCTPNGFTSQPRKTGRGFIAFIAVEANSFFVWEERFPRSSRQLAANTILSYGLAKGQLGLVLLAHSAKMFRCPVPRNPASQAISSIGCCIGWGTCYETTISNFINHNT